MQADPGPGCEFVGMSWPSTLWREGTWLPLQQGLTVLYGLNGAGKSSVLDELREFFAGGSDSGDRGLRLYVRLPALAAACSAIEPGAEREWVAAIWKNIGSAFEVEDRIRQLEYDRWIWYEAFCGGYFFIQQAPNGTQGFEIGIAARLDGSVPAVQEAVYPNAPPRTRDELVKILSDAERDGEFTVRGFSSPGGAPELLHSRDIDPQSEFLLKMMRQELADIDSGEAAEPAPPDLIHKAVEKIVNHSFEPGTLSANRADPWDGHRHVVEGEEAGGFVPLVVIARTWYPFVTVIDAEESIDRVARTGQHLWRTQGKSGSGMDVGELDPAWLTELQDVAQRHYDRVFLDAPRLRLDRAHGAESFTCLPFRWSASDREQPLEDLQKTAIDSLSKAQRGWADFSIALATRKELPHSSFHETAPQVVLLDEPEAGLHRTAEAHMAEGLSALAHNQPGTYVIAATHTPMLLDDPSSAVVEVKRTPQERGDPGDPMTKNRPHFARRLRALNTPGRESM